MDSEILMKLATVLAKQEDVARRLDAIEGEIGAAKKSIYRTVWVIMIAILGQAVAKFGGLVAILEALK